MARNMKLQKKIIFPLVFFLAIILVGQVKGDEEDISISALKYTNDLETGEQVILIGNGKDYGTIYNYKMYDDDDDQYRSNDDNGNNDDCDVQNCLPQNSSNDHRSLIDNNSIDSFRSEMKSLS